VCVCDVCTYIKEVCGDGLEQGGVQQALEDALGQCALVTGRSKVGGGARYLFGHIYIYTYILSEN
jgi:hypothetical protein